jgi:hypothetical protein
MHILADSIGKEVAAQAKHIKLQNVQLSDAQAALYRLKDEYQVLIAAKDMLKDVMTQFTDI